MASATGMTLLLDPRRPSAGNDEMTLLAGDGARDLDTGRFDWRPTTDDRPFFSHVVRSLAGPTPPDPFGVLRSDQHSFALLCLLGFVTIVNDRWRCWSGLPWVLAEREARQHAGSRRAVWVLPFLTVISCVTSYP